MSLYPSQIKKLQSLLDTPYRSETGYINPIMNDLRNIPENLENAGNFNTYVRYLPAYTDATASTATASTATASTATAYSASASTSASSNSIEVPAIILHKGTSSTTKTLSYVAKGTYGKVYKNADITVLSKNIWKKVTIHNAQDIKDLFMEAFTMAILGSDVDPEIRNSTCNITGFYRPTHIGTALGYGNDTPTYGYSLIIRMDSYQSLKDYLGTGIRDLNNIKLIIHKTANVLLKLRERYNFLHCDLHKDNVMFKSDGSPVIIDFGRACLTIGTTQYATNEYYLDNRFSYDMLIYVMSLYCHMRNNMIVPREQVNATFRDILMYNDSDLLNFFTSRYQFPFPNEWVGTYNFNIGQIYAGGKGGLYETSTPNNSGGYIPHPTQEEMTNHIISIRDRSKARGYFDCFGNAYRCVGNACTKCFTKKTKTNRRNKTRRQKKRGRLQ